MRFGRREEVFGVAAPTDTAGSVIARIAHGAYLWGLLVLDATGTPKNQHPLAFTHSRRRFDEESELYCYLAQGLGILPRRVGERAGQQPPLLQLEFNRRDVGVAHGSVLRVVIQHRECKQCAKFRMLENSLKTGWRRFLEPKSL
jgi:hypothetical protein